LGDQPMPYSWSVLMITTVLGCIATFALFVKFRPRIAYWI
jgi:ABC-type polysaccharide/polyol phosphate export permease